MSIKRSVPDVGYATPTLFRQINISETVRANNMVYFSGIVAAAGAAMPPQAVAKGDAAGQVRFVLDILGRLLAEESLSFANLVAVTVYTPDLDAVMANIGLFAEAFAGHPPTFQAIGVKNLSSPDYLLELVAVAAVTSGQ